jgi:hypothetical protein
VLLYLGSLGGWSCRGNRSERAEREADCSAYSIWSENAESGGAHTDLFLALA